MFLIGYKAQVARTKEPKPRCALRMTSYLNWSAASTRLTAGRSTIVW